MSTQQQVNQYINEQNEPKRADMLILHSMIQKIMPDCKLWFLDGKDDKGKAVTNPNVGYGSYFIKYANGTSREFYQIGFSGNTTGISVNIMGIEDKKHLINAYGKTIGKASVTGYCIKFKSLQDINFAVLQEAIQFGINATQQ
ncbi:MAG: hypothetical protein RL065_90 [Bacteroidota bacterium]|jgi:hypothetical protein